MVNTLYGRRRWHIEFFLGKCSITSFVVSKSSDTICRRSFVGESFVFLSLFVLFSFTQQLKYTQDKVTLYVIGYFNSVLVFLSDFARQSN